MTSLFKRFHLREFSYALVTSCRHFDVPWTPWGADPVRGTANPTRHIWQNFDYSCGAGTVCVEIGCIRLRYKQKESGIYCRNRTVLRRHALCTSNFGMPDAMSKAAGKRQGRGHHGLNALGEKHSGVTSPPRECRSLSIDLLRKKNGIVWPCMQSNTNEFRSRLGRPVKVLAGGGNEQ